MPIEVSENGTIMATGEGVEVMRILAVRRALMLEIKTGMKMSSRYSTMNVAKNICGSPKRTKAGVLKDLEAFMDEVGIPYNV